MSKLTQNGISTTTAPGQEQWETFTAHLSRRPEQRIQYDYRHPDGQLFSCVKKTLEDCRAARDQWIRKKILKALYGQMGQVVDRHVKFYKCDFDADKEYLNQFIETGLPKGYIWAVRPCGTHLFRLYESKDFKDDHETDWPKLFKSMNETFNYLPHIMGRSEKFLYFHIDTAKARLHQITHEKGVELLSRNLAEWKLATAR